MKIKCRLSLTHYRNSKWKQSRFLILKDTEMHLMTQLAKCGRTTAADLQSELKGENGAGEVTQP